jgi:ankyrin repeat protein
MGRLNRTALAILISTVFLYPFGVQAAKQKHSQPTSAERLIIKRDYKAAFAAMMSRAKKGDSLAQFKVAEMYRLGLGIPKDETAARLWLGKASAAGSNRAAVLLRRLERPILTTAKKLTNSNSANTSTSASVANFENLPKRPSNQPDWLTLAVARKDKAAIEGLTATLQKPVLANTNLALVTATKNADIATLKILVTAKIAKQNDTKSRSPLMLAVAMNNNEMIDVLLQNEPYVEDKNLLSLATKNCQPAIVSKLSAADAKTSTKPNLVLVAQYCSNWPDFKELLRDADINATDSHGRTAAWFAAAKGDTSLLAWLAKSGVDFSLADSDGLSPLHVAAVNKQAFSVRYILSVFDKADIGSLRGTTPLMLAAFVGCTDCIAPLLEKSAEIDQKNSDGDTSLVFAVRGQQMASAALLAKNGANLDARNEAGDTPSKLAERLGFPLLKGATE